MQSPVSGGVHDCVIQQKKKKIQKNNVLLECVCGVGDTFTLCYIDFQRSLGRLIGNVHRTDVYVTREPRTKVWVLMLVDKANERGMTETEYKVDFSGKVQTKKKLNERTLGSKCFHRTRTRNEPAKFKKKFKEHGVYF